MTNSTPTDSLFSESLPNTSFQPENRPLPAACSEAAAIISAISAWISGELSGNSRILDSDAWASVSRPVNRAAGLVGWVLEKAYYP